MVTRSAVNSPPEPEIGLNSEKAKLVDPFRRTITYLRVSVTDRCDFRCTYCMPQNMSFLPRKELLTLEELERLCIAFIEKGVTKLRLTGGEPLVRRDIMSLVRTLGRRIGSGLDELTMTTNGSQLAKFAEELYDCGIRRINVSLDTLSPEKFRLITRRGDFRTVMAGIEAAQKAGLLVKLNAVAMRDVNGDEIPDLIRFAHGLGMEMTVIETMPMGDVEEDRTDRYLPLSQLRADLERQFTMTETGYATGGPARYVYVQETGGRLGFITPMTHNFCANCNRVRLTCTGMLYMCLGQNDASDLRTVLRGSDDEGLLHKAIDDAIARKPWGHDFMIGDSGKYPAVGRHMNVTGG